MTEGTQRNRIVASGIVGLPWEMRASAIATLGSGGQVHIHDFSRGFDPGVPKRPFSERTLEPPQTNGFAERNLDFRLEKSVPIFGGTSATLIAEVFNAFNTFQGSCLDNFDGPGDETLGKSNCVVNLPRRYQLGVRVGF